MGWSQKFLSRVDVLEHPSRFEVRKQTSESYYDVRSVHKQFGPVWQHFLERSENNRVPCDGGISHISWLENT